MTNETEQVNQITNGLLFEYASLRKMGGFFSQPEPETVVTLLQSTVPGTNNVWKLYTDTEQLKDTFTGYLPDESRAIVTVIKTRFSKSASDIVALDEDIVQRAIDQASYNNVRSDLLAISAIRKSASTDPVDDFNFFSQNKDIIDLLSSPGSATILVSVASRFDRQKIIDSLIEMNKVTKLEGEALAILTISSLLAVRSANDVKHDMANLVEHSESKVKNLHKLSAEKLAVLMFAIEVGKCEDTTIINIYDRVKSDKVNDSEAVRLTLEVVARLKKIPVLSRTKISDTGLLFARSGNPLGAVLEPGLIYLGE